MNISGCRCYRPLLLKDNPCDVAIRGHLRPIDIQGKTIGENDICIFMGKNTVIFRAFDHRVTGIKCQSSRVSRLNDSGVSRVTVIRRIVIVVSTNPLLIAMKNEFPSSKRYIFCPQ